MQATLSAHLAPMVHEDPHEEIRQILKNLSYQISTTRIDVKAVESALRNLLNTERMHDAEEQRIMESSFCPNFREHMRSHYDIMVNIHQTIRILHETTTLNTDWRPFIQQMRVTSRMIEDHMIEFDDPLLQAVAAGNA